MQLHYEKIAWIIAPRLGRTDFVVLQETSALNLRVNDRPLVSFVNFPGTLLAWRRRFTGSPQNSDNKAR
jgi:hypothetical protein